MFRQTDYAVYSSLIVDVHKANICNLSELSTKKVKLNVF